MASMKNVLGIILGGGRGSRLWPLTHKRAKPAVPIAGKYRLIDIPLSNCLNSGIQRIAILTQFNSVSLNRHVSKTYHFDFFHPGWVEILAAEQTEASEAWFQGSADAVRKHFPRIAASGAEHVLILAGDHLYRMNYGPMLTHHLSCGADLTIAIKPISRAEAGRFGLLQMGSDFRIESFYEKPQDPAIIDRCTNPADPAGRVTASMGIYLFRIQALGEVLSSAHVDFGSGVVPEAIPERAVFGFPFEGYWEDVGTVRTFYEANLSLARQDPPFSFYDSAHPFFTSPRFLPGSRLHDVAFRDVLLSEGCVVDRATASNSILGIRSVVGPGVVLEDSILMGADSYEAELSGCAAQTPALGIGAGSRIEGANIDKNARIGCRVRIQRFPCGTDLDADGWFVRDGIVIIPKGATLPDDTVIGPA